MQESVEENSHHMEEETIEGIEKQYNYNEVVHYVEEKDPSSKNKKDRNINNNQKDKDSALEEISNDSNEPRLISSRGSSRMLFADLNVEDIE